MDKYIINDNTLEKYNGTESIVFVPAVEYIGPNAFKGNTNVHKVVFPEGVKQIGDSCFECCYNLETVILPESIESFGKGVFNNSGIMEIRVPSQLTDLPQNTFFACFKLENIDLHSTSIVRIGENCFGSCGRLKTVIMPKALKIIEQSAFYLCQQLHKVVLPSSIERIDYYAFAHCKYLATSTLHIPETAEISKEAFLGCCEFGYRKTRIMASFVDEEYDFSNKIAYEFKDKNQLADIGFEEMYQFFEDTFQEEIEAALSQYKKEAAGYFNLKSEAEKLYSAACDYINNMAGDKKIVLSEIDDSDNIIASVEYKLADYLTYCIKSRVENETEDYDVGAIVEDSLEKFMEKGIWNYGLKSKEAIETDSNNWPKYILHDGVPIWRSGSIEYEPIIWFGPEGSYPQGPWILSSNMTSESLSFWFEEDPNLLMENIIEDCNESFLIWYLWECGRSYPDMDYIMKSCPISFDENTSPRNIKEIINQFFIDKTIE